MFKSDSLASNDSDDARNNTVDCPINLGEMTKYRQVTASFGNVGES